MIEALWALAGVTALIYGLVLTGRPPSALRTVIKTIPAATLAVIAALCGAPWQLVAGLALCALGDAFLAGDPGRWLPAGLVAFLAGHGAYIFLFAGLREPGVEPTPFQLAGLATTAAAGVGLLAFLWKSLGLLRPAVILYVIGICVMTGFSLLAPGWAWTAMLGAAAFMASDAILATSLFRRENLFGSPRISGWAVWFLYCAAQSGIAWPYVGGY